MYEYHYKDHLGNLRMSVRKGDEAAEYLATSELDMQDYEEEELGFENIKLTQNMEVTAKSGSVSALVGNWDGYDKPVGPFKQFEVGKGDAIDASVFVRYLYDANQANNQSTLPVGSTMENTFVPDGGNWGSLAIYPEINIKQDGYAKVYVANESKTKVWFDDLEITHKKGIIAQENQSEATPVPLRYEHGGDRAEWDT